MFLQLPLDILEQLDHAALHDHIQRRGGLIADHDARLEQRGQGDRHALAHAARELVRVGVQTSWRQTQLDEMAAGEFKGIRL